MKSILDLEKIKQISLNMKLTKSLMLIPWFVSVSSGLVTVFHSSLSLSESNSSGGSSATMGSSSSSKILERVTGVVGSADGSRG